MKEIRSNERISFVYMLEINKFNKGQICICINNKLVSKYGYIFVRLGFGLRVLKHAQSCRITSKNIPIL